jgi:hypothetical protein
LLIRGFAVLTLAVGTFVVRWGRLMFRVSGRRRLRLGGRRLWLLLGHSAWGEKS